MGDVMDLSARVASDLGRRLDDVLFKQIELRLGHVPALDSLKKRMDRHTFISDPHKREHWLLDGQPLLITYPIDCVTVDSKITYTQRFEVPLAQTTKDGRQGTR